MDETVNEDVVVLGSDSHTLDGCDRVTLIGGQVVVQGTLRSSYPDSSALRVPAGETLSAISPEVFLAAADELRRRMELS